MTVKDEIADENLSYLLHCLASDPSQEAEFFEVFVNDDNMSEFSLQLVAAKAANYIERLQIENEAYKSPQRVLGWIGVKDKPPERGEPLLYCQPDQKRNGCWLVGIAYWTKSQKWNPDCQSERNPEGFTHWMPLPDPPRPT